MRLSEAMTGYWLDKRLQFSETTIPGYERTFRRFVAFVGDVELESVTADDVRRFLAHLGTLGLSRRTVADAWIPLSSFWTWAASELGVPHIIRGKVKRPKFQQRRIEPLTQDEIRRLLAAVESFTWQRKGKAITSRRPTALRDRAALLVLLDSGLRAQRALRPGR